MNINHSLVQTLSRLAVFLCMIAIYQLSAQPAAISNGNSKVIVAQMVDATMKLTRAKITEPDKSKLIDRINSTAREYMHGVVFLLLGLLVQNAVSREGAKGLKAIAISLAICVAYAITDEIHQLFVLGRAFQISDLTMDTIGSMIGIATVWFLYCKAGIRSKG